MTQSYGYGVLVGDGGTGVLVGVAVDVALDAADVGVGVVDAEGTGVNGTLPSTA